MPLHRDPASKTFQPVIKSSLDGITGSRGRHQACYLGRSQVRLVSFSVVALFFVFLWPVHGVAGVEFDWVAFSSLDADLGLDSDLVVRTRFSFFRSANFSSMRRRRLDFGLGWLLTLTISGLPGSSRNESRTAWAWGESFLLVAAFTSSRADGWCDIWSSRVDVLRAFE